MATDRYDLAVHCAYCHTLLRGCEDTGLPQFCDAECHEEFCAEESRRANEEGPEPDPNYVRPEETSSYREAMRDAGRGGLL